MTAWYLDTSAFMKLVRAESETDALRDRLAGSELVSCDLLRTEALRVAGRIDDALIARCRLRIDRIDRLIGLDASLLTNAGQLAPARLRSLDAIHLSACLLAGSDVDGMVTYDLRLAEAGRLAGVTVVSPS